MSMPEPPSGRVTDAPAEPTKPVPARPNPGPVAARRAPQPRRRQEDSPFTKGLGAGLGLTFGVGIVAMALVLVSLLGSLILSATTRDLTTESHLWGPADASNKLLALSISGAIQGAGSGNLFGAATYGYEIADQLDALEADDYDGVVLLMDTPGGSIYGSRAIADAVLRYQERTGRKVVAYVQSMSASGGMYSMAPADLIIADYGTMIGSIGVIFGPFERYRDVTAITGTILTPGVETAGGISVEYLTQGTGKDFGNPYREMTEAEREHYTNSGKVEYDKFVEFVSEHRDIPAQTIVDDLGAFMFDPETAVEKGLVDEVMGRPDAFKAAARLNGVDENDTKVLAPAMPGAFSQLLGAEARVPGHNTPLSTADGVLPTSELCVGPAMVMAYAGDLAAACGA